MLYISSSNIMVLLSISKHYILHVIFICRATLDLNLRHINLEKKNIHETHSRKVRERDRDLRKLKKIDLQLKIADDALQHTQQQKEKIKAEVNTQLNDVVDSNMMMT